MVVLGRKGHRKEGISYDIGKSEFLVNYGLYFLIGLIPELFLWSF